MKCMIRWNLYFLLLIGLFWAGETNAQMRHSYLLDGEWSFKLERPGSCWEEIRVPHTWNACDGTTPDYYRGKGHYRYQLELTKEMLDQRVFLRFEAASLWAEVKVNNQVVGTHFGGFTAFCFEITPYVCAGENQVDVVVSNAKDLPMAPLSRKPRLLRPKVSVMPSWVVWLHNWLQWSRKKPAPRCAASS